jgi:probable HAF family extracellular repeat protein
MRLLPVSFAVLVMIVAVSSLCLAQSYVVTDLGTLGGATSGAFAVNSKGQVAGYSTVNANIYIDHAFIWSSSAGMLDLGGLPGDSSSYAFAINDNGQVAGWSYGNATGAHAFVWTEGKGMQSIGTLGGSNSFAYGLNSVGMVVGYADTVGNSAQHAFVWNSAEGMTDLGTLGGNYSFATAINDSGQVTGSSYLADGVTLHAFLWTKETGIQDLGAMGGGNSGGNAISASGQIVGTTTWPKHAMSVLWTEKAGMRFIAGRLSQPLGIQSSQIVGYFEHNPQHAFLWTPESLLQDLNDLIGSHLGWYLGEATGINKGGQIVAIGQGSFTHALLLTPTNQGSSQRSKP